MNGKTASKISTGVILALFLAFSCTTGYRYYQSSKSSAAYKNSLLSMYNSGKLGETEMFSVVQAISNEMLAAGETEKLICFLEDVLYKYPSNVFAAYHAFTIATLYKNTGYPKLAAVYYHRIIRNFPDLAIKGESIHYLCLMNLLEIETEPAYTAEYRHDLLTRFPEKISSSTQYFLLGMDYEKLGLWDQSINAYRQFVAVYDGMNIAGYPDALVHARNYIDLSEATIDWGYASLDSLLDDIKDALRAGSARSLARIKAKIGFFAMDWHQDNFEGNSNVLFDFSPFMTAGRIYYNDTLEPYSTNSEAYLRTRGWSLQSPTWIPYFRKINCPFNPEVHNKWEWAGIFFGDRIQTN